MATLGPSFIRLILIGEPIWNIVEDVAAGPHLDDDDKIIIGFKANFSLPPSDFPAYAACTRGAFSAPIQALASAAGPAGRDAAAERRARDIVHRMLEAVRAPTIASLVDYVLEAAAGGARRRIKFEIDIFLHRMPGALLALDSNKNGIVDERVVDINVLLETDRLLNNNERIYVVVQRVLPDDFYSLRYEQREWNVLTDILPHCEFSDDLYFDDHVALLPPLEFDDAESHNDATERNPFLHLKLIGEPEWSVEQTVHHAAEPDNYKMFITFKARFSLPPMDNPRHAVHIQRTFSAPWEALLVGADPDMITLMLEAVRLPIIPSIADEIVHQMTTTAATGIHLKFYINVTLHQMPNILLHSQRREDGQITDFSALLNPNQQRQRLSVVIDSVFPRSLYYFLSYEQRELINIDEHDQQIDYDYIEEVFGGADQYLDVPDLDFGGGDFVIGFLPASKESIEAKLVRLKIKDENIRENHSSMTCSVCFEDIRVGTVATRLPCLHYFHGDCIVQWLETSKFCPLCRFEIA